MSLEKLDVFLQNQHIEADVQASKNALNYFSRDTMFFHDKV